VREGRLTDKPPHRCLGRLALAAEVGDDLDDLAPIMQFPWRQSQRLLGVEVAVTVDAEAALSGFRKVRLQHLARLEDGALERVPAPAVQPGHDSFTCLPSPSCTLTASWMRPMTTSSSSSEPIGSGARSRMCTRTS